MYRLILRRFCNSRICNRYHSNILHLRYSNDEAAYDDDDSLSVYTEQSSSDIDILIDAEQDYSDDYEDYIDDDLLPLPWELYAEEQ